MATVMTGFPSAHDNEETTLLSNSQGCQAVDPSQSTLPTTESLAVSPHRLLPVAFLAALAMSSTAATTYYAYATLLCVDLGNCVGNETRKFARLIALTTAASNILGMIGLGPLQSIMKQHHKLGLFSWLVTRSMSASMLLIGVRTHNIYVALSGRVFEGLASDNLLHFTLNAIYALSAEPETTSSLIGYSLALYMVGISISPFVGGFFRNFTISFFMAIGLFAITIAYLLLGTSPKRTYTKEPAEANPSRSSTRVLARLSYRRLLATFTAPIYSYAQRPASLFCGLSMLTYNIVQSYTFSALLVHTSIRFKFSTKQNGLLLTIAHSIAALYIFITLYVAPQFSRISRMGGHTHTGIANNENQRTQDGTRAVISLSLQALSLLAIGLATRTWHIYAATVLLALGLPTPSYMKAYVVGLFRGSKKGEALAALAAMEVVGDVLGPLTLGAWQSYNAMGGDVFFGAAGMVAISLTLFTIALSLERWEIRKHGGVPATGI